MGTINIPESEVWEAIEDGVKVSTGSWKWGTVETYVVEKEPGKFYRFNVTMHSQEGLQLQISGPVKATQVHEVEKTIKTWEPVPDPGPSEGDEP